MRACCQTLVDGLSCPTVSTQVTDFTYQLAPGLLVHSGSILECDAHAGRFVASDARIVVTEVRRFA